MEADTSVRRAGCDATSLRQAIGDVILRWPRARLVRNAVGNLSVLVDGQCHGWVDLTFGTFVEHEFDDEPVR